LATASNHFLKLVVLIPGGMVVEVIVFEVDVQSVLLLPRPQQRILGAGQLIPRKIQVQIQTAAVGTSEPPLKMTISRI
jgi:hypothetical protein